MPVYDAVAALGGHLTVGARCVAQMRADMRHIISLYLLLLAAWALWSGLSWPWGEHFEPLIAVMGVLFIFQIWVF